MIWLATVFILPQYFYQINLDGIISSYFQKFIQFFVYIWSCCISCQTLKKSDPYSCLPDSTHSSKSTDENSNNGGNNNSSSGSNSSGNNNNNDQNNIELKSFEDIENPMTQNQEEENKIEIEKYQNKDVNNNNNNNNNSSLDNILPLAFTSKYNNLNVSYYYNNYYSYFYFLQLFLF